MFERAFYARCAELATEYRELFLEVYAPVIATQVDKSNSNVVTYISSNLLRGKPAIKRALRELATFIPRETITILKNALVDYSPVHVVAVSTFIITAMTLREEGLL